MVLRCQSVSEHDVTRTGPKAGVGPVLEWLPFAEIVRTSSNAAAHRSTYQHKTLLPVTTYAAVAQWIEHLTTDQKVRGSSPFSRAMQKRPRPATTARSGSLLRRPIQPCGRTTMGVSHADQPTGGHHASRRRPTRQRTHCPAVSLVVTTTAISVGHVRSHFGSVQDGAIPRTESVPKPPGPRRHVGLDAPNRTAVLRDLIDKWAAQPDGERG